MTGTPDNSALSPLPLRSSAISFRMSPTVLVSLLLATTSGSSDSTISASVPSSDNSLPRMISLDLTVSTNLSYSAPCGSSLGNSAAGSLPGAGACRAENSEIKPRVPSTSCRSVTRSRSFSRLSRSISVLPSTTTSTSNSVAGKRLISDLYCL